MSAFTVAIGERARRIGTAIATGGNSNEQDFEFSRRTFTVYVVPHGTVTTASFQLQSSPDGGTTWFNIGTADTAVTQHAFTVDAIAAQRVRVNVTITGGGNVDLYMGAV